MANPPVSGICWAPAELAAEADAEADAEAEAVAEADAEEEPRSAPSITSCMWVFS